MKRLFVLIVTVISVVGCSNKDVIDFNSEREKIEMIDDKLFYKNKPYTGVVVYRRFSGVLKEKVNYYKGLKNGVTIKYDSNDNIEIRTSFVEGKSIPPQPPGSFSTQTEKQFIRKINGKIVYDSLPLTGEVYDYEKKRWLFYFQGIEIPNYVMYDDNELNSNDKGIITFNGKPFSGNIISYYEKFSEDWVPLFPEVEFISPYSKGLKNGKTIYYYNNGTVQEEYDYIEGKLNGIVKMYYENGETKYIVDYIDGLRQGKLISYYENGILQNIGTYLDDEFDGEFSRFNEYGKPVWEGYYKHGKKDGEWFLHLDDSDVIQKIIFNNDVEISRENINKKDLTSKEVISQ